MYAIIPKTEEKLIKSDQFVLSFEILVNRSCNDCEIKTEQDITKGKGVKKVGKSDDYQLKVDYRFTLPDFMIVKSFSLFIIRRKSIFTPVIKIRAFVLTNIKDK